MGVMMRRWTTWLTALALGASLGCGQPEANGGAGGDNNAANNATSNNAGNGEEGPAFEPVFVDYTGDEEPVGVVPEGESWEEVALPLEQTGADTGQQGATYAATLAGYYLLRVQLPTGRFNYQYDMEEREFIEDEDSIHRQCGSTITQAWLWRATRREEFLISTRRALEYLYGEAEEVGEEQLELADLGGTSLLAIATSLVVLHADVGDAYDARLAKLGARVLDRLNEDGSWKENDKYFLKPAQAMTALEHLHAATGEEAYLDGLERAATWLIEHPDEHNFDKYMALWANEPLTYLYDQRPSEELAQLVYDLADPIVETQHTPYEHDEFEWIGGYHSDSSNKPLWNTCLRLEAVIDAYRLARLHGDEERQERYGQSARWAAHFLMKLQFREGDSDDPLINGAVPFSYTNPVLRVDVAHHVANALLKVVEYQDLEDFPGRRAVDEISP